MITMKKTIVLALLASLFLCYGEKAHAQVAHQEQLIYSFGGVFKDVSGTKLSKEDLQNYLSSYEYADYLSASRKFKNGVILTGVGIGCLASSALIVNGVMREGDRLDDTNADDYFDDDHTRFLGDVFYGGMLSCVLIGGGLVCTAIGIPKTFIANGKLKKVATDHNNQPSVSLSFGVQQYGYGIALTF